MGEPVEWSTASWWQRVQMIFWLVVLIAAACYVAGFVGHVAWWLSRLGWGTW